MREEKIKDKLIKNENYLLAVDSSGKIDNFAKRLCWLFFPQNKADSLQFNCNDFKKDNTASAFN